MKRVPINKDSIKDNPVVKKGVSNLASVKPKQINKESVARLRKLIKNQKKNTNLSNVPATKNTGKNNSSTSKFIKKINKNNDAKKIERKNEIKINSGTNEKKRISKTIIDLSSDLARLREEITNLKDQLANQNNAVPYAIDAGSIIMEPDDAVSNLPCNEATRPFKNHANSKNLNSEHDTAIFGGIIDRARIQWLIGDWQGLCQIDGDQISQHPDGGKLALFASIGNNRCGNLVESRRLLKLAIQLGCDRKLSTRLMLASAYRAVSTLMQLNGKEDRAQKNLLASASVCGENAITIAHNGVNSLTLNHNGPNKIGLSATNKIPRLIIAGGLVRSGSTVLLNIVMDLLRSVDCEPIKYFTDDLKSITSFRDHIIQNKRSHFVLKTHGMDAELIDLYREINAMMVFSIRNIFEISASYLRMAQNPSSDFYQTAEFTLDQLCGIIQYEIEFYDAARQIENCIIFDCQELSSGNIYPVVEKIADFFGIARIETNIQKIADKHSRKFNSILSSKISPSQSTSLHHDSDTFFHKYHVLANGTNVDEYLSENWKNEIVKRFHSRIDTNGFLIQ
jgi:hypothetical protein